MCPHGGPLLCCNLLELIGLGGFWWCFFSFPSVFLFHWRASDGQTWKELLICIEVGRQGWTEDTPNCLPGKGRKSAVRSHHFSTLGGFFFFLSLSVIHFGRNCKYNFKQSTKTWKKETKNGSQMLESDLINLAPLFFFFPFLIGFIVWHWLIKLYRFQVYDSIIIICILCVHPKSCLLPPPFIPLYPLRPPPPPFPSGNKHTIVCLWGLVCFFS